MFGYGSRHLGKDLAAVAGDDLLSEQKLALLQKAFDGVSANPKIADHKAVEFCIVIGCRHGMGSGIRDLSDALLRKMVQANRDLSVFANETLSAIMIGKGDMSPEYDKFGENAFAKNASQMFMQSIGSYPFEKRVGLGKWMLDHARKTEVPQYHYHVANGLGALCEGNGALQKAFGSAFYEMATAGETDLVSLYGYKGLKEAYESGYEANSTHVDTILARLTQEEPGVLKAGAAAFVALAHSFPELVQNKETRAKLNAVAGKDKSGALKRLLNTCASQDVHTDDGGGASESHRPQNTALPFGAMRPAL